MRSLIIATTLLALAATATAQTSVRLADEDGNNVVRANNMQVTSTADRTVITLDMVLDSLRVPSNRYRAFTPILRSNDGSQQQRLKTLIVSGRTQDIVFEREGIDPLYADNCDNIRRMNGQPQSYAYTDAVSMQPWHETPEVLMESDLCGCGDTLRSQLASLGTLAKPDPYELIALANQEPNPDKPDLQLHGSAYITFVVDRWEMKPDYMDNRRELRKITDTLDIMVADKNITVKEIKIHGWASPESPYAHNRMLATNRAQSLTDWLRKNYQLPASAFAPAEATPENWIGLREAIEGLGSDVLPHKTEVYDIVRNLLLQEEREVERTADATEARMKKLYPADYTYLLRNVYPGLRRSDYDITFNIRQFNTLEECLQIYRTKPNQLSKHELWRVAQTFQPFSDDYNRVMQTTLNYYPEDEAANINLANVAIQQHDLLKAETLLQHAGNGSAAENARAVLCIIRGQYDEAARHLDRAQQLGLDVSRNRQAIEILR